MPEIRKNLITGEYVILAPERAKRPEDFVPSAKPSGLPERSDKCPFCPGNESMTPPATFSIPEDGGWSVRCVPNKFSALAPNGNIWVKDDGLKFSMAGVGLHEVVVETPLHNRTLALLLDHEVRAVVETYRNRLNAFYGDPRVGHVIVFRNHGISAGTSLEHPHSQIVGLPTTPIQVVDRSTDMREYFEANRSCMVCDVRRDELDDRVRVIMTTDHYTAVIPYAALSPFHTWILPKRHSACFGNITDEEVSELASVMKLVLMKLNAGLGDPDYNLVIRSWSPREDAADHLHWYIAIVPRVTKAAGFELGTGMYINPSLPEDSAEFLRSVDI